MATYCLKVGRHFYYRRNGSTTVGTLRTLRDALSIARSWATRPDAKPVHIYKLHPRKEPTRVSTYLPSPAKPTSSTELWVIDASHTSDGTVSVWHKADESGIPLPKGPRILGGPSIPIDPGYKAVVQVTVEVLEPGRAYPKNPFTSKAYSSKRRRSNGLHR